jgi:hypothetical protein
MGAAAVWTGVKALGSWLFKTTTGNIVLGAATSAAGLQSRKRRKSK